MLLTKLECNASPTAKQEAGKKNIFFCQDLSQQDQ